MIGVSLLFFFLIEWAPGDFATIRAAALVHDIEPIDGALVERLTISTGLDLPAVDRYLTWLARMGQGDFGNSFGNQKPIAPLLFDRVANTLLLALLTLGLAVPLAIGFAVYCALHRGRWFDRGISGVANIIYSLPEFLIGYALVTIFAIHLGWFPSLSLAPMDASIWTTLHSLGLPVFALVLIMGVSIFLPCRNLVVSVQTLEHVQMARLKGLRKWRILVFHILPVCIGPLINIVLIGFANLIGGVIITEIVFVYPGLGQLMVEGVLRQDAPLVLACGVVISFFYISMVMAADLVTLITNPRLRNP